MTNRNKLIKNLSFFILLILLYSCNPTPKNNTDQTQSGTDSSHALMPQDSTKFDPYCNARFNYCIDYPDELIPQSESTNGDGKVFKNKQGEDVLTVFGTNNLDPDGKISIEKQYNDDLKMMNEDDSNKRVITYKKLGETFYVLSGHRKNKMFYQETILKDGAFAVAILEYSDAEKNALTKILERIFTSFK